MATEGAKVVGSGLAAAVSGIGAAAPVVAPYEALGLGISGLTSDAAAAAGSAAALALPDWTLGWCDSKDAAVHKQRPRG